MLCSRKGPTPKTWKASSKPLRLGRGQTASKLISQPMLSGSFPLAEDQIVANVLAQSDTKFDTQLLEERATNSSIGFVKTKPRLIRFGTRYI